MRVCVCSCLPAVPTMEGDSHERTNTLACAMNVIVRTEPPRASWFQFVRTYVPYVGTQYSNNRLRPKCKSNTYILPGRVHTHTHTHTQVHHGTVKLKREGYCNMTLLLQKFNNCAPHARSQTTDIITLLRITTLLLE